MASKLQDTIEFLKDFGLFDVILPFLLIFAITYAILQKTKLLGKNDNLDSVVALVFALIVISANKIVATILTAIPNVLLLLIIAFSFLLMIGLFFKDENFLQGGETERTWYYWFFSVAMFIGVIFIFLGAWTMDSGESLLSYIIGNLYDNIGTDLVGGVVLVGIVALAIWFITKPSGGGKNP